MLVLMLPLLMASGCESSSTNKGIETQEEAMDKAMKSEQVPELDHFRTREAITKWMERMDKPSKTYYIYLLSNTGSKIGYYVGKTRPISVGTYLTPTKKEYHVGGGSGPHPLGPAPSLDGTYDAGGSTSSQYFFFEAGSDAYMEIKGVNYLVSDQPLSVDAPRITVDKDGSSPDTSKPKNDN